MTIGLKIDGKKLRSKAKNYRRSILRNEMHDGSYDVVCLIFFVSYVLVLFCVSHSEILTTSKISMFEKNLIIVYDENKKMLQELILCWKELSIYQNKKRRFKFWKNWHKRKCRYELWWNISTVFRYFLNSFEREIREIIFSFADKSSERRNISGVN